MDGSIATFKNGYAAGFAGITNSFSYNTRVQPVNISASAPSATVFSIGYDFHLASGDNGNVFQLVNYKDNTRSQIFTYDQLNRLTSGKTSASSAWGTHYTVDAWGNLAQKTPMAGMLSGENFSQTVLSSNRMTGWSYDAAGNLLNDGAHSYTYDAEGRIKTMDGTGGTYTYGPDGERVRKDSASGSVEYVYFGSQMIGEFNPATNAWTDYIFAGGKRIAKDTSSNAGAAQYYQGDHLGSTRIMTDASGTRISECTYAPYGEQVACSPDNPSNRYRYTGKERDSETGMDYFGARYYSSSMGRFLSADWSAGPATVPYAHLENPQTLNLYAYVDNNPINGVDFDGHSRNEYMVAYSGGWGLDQMEVPSGMAIETDTTLLLDTSTGIATVVSTQTSLVTQQLVNDLGSVEQQQQQQVANQQGTAAGQTYKTRDEAAKSAERAALSATDEAGRKYEYGGWILQNKSGRYTYTIPITFKQQGHFYPDSETLPKGYKGVADYHTHPHSDSAEGRGFSAGDEDHAIFYGRVGYVADTYSRDMFRYTPQVTTWKPNEYCCGEIGDFVAHIP